MAPSRVVYAVPGRDIPEIDDGRKANCRDQGR
jgi:hypothetical protein